MRESDFRAPDAEAMERLLAAHPRDRAGLALRLAWRAGLARDELAALTWGQVEGAALRLRDRVVPLDGETAACLRLARGRAGNGVRVLPLAPQSLSRLARRALDEAGQTGVRLNDLRVDCARRLLAEHDAAYVLRVTGFSASSLRALRGGSGARAVQAGVAADARLREVLRAERGTNVGLALALTWHLGLTARELTALTWEAFDLDAGTARLARGEVSLPRELCALLAEAKARRAPEDDAHVLLTARSRRPMDAARLSALAREALDRGGVGLTLRALRGGAARNEAERRALALARERGSLSRGEAAEALGLAPREAGALLLSLAERGRLTRVNARYYPGGAVTPAARQAEAIRDYLARYGAAYRQDIAQLLGVGPRPAARILKAMVERGELARASGSRRYTLPNEP